MTRGSEKGIKKVSEEMLLVSAEVVARIMAYTKAAGLTDDLHKAGAPVDHIPQEIEDQMDKALNKLDDLVTLESSAIGQV